MRYGPALFALLVISASTTARAQEDADLAKKIVNPVADLISVPFQFNYDKGFGPSEGGRFTLNIQPVIPVRLNEDWNLIIRTILPVIAQQATVPGGSSEAGLGDTTQSFFFSPRNPTNGIIWGIGPVFLWPTGSNPALRSEKWGAGPTAVVLKQEHGWTYGILANHIWSYAGSATTPNISSTFLQPFINYTFPSTFGITLNTESSYNWITNQWTVPINLMFSHIIKIGRLPLSVQAGPRYYVETPAGGPRWGARFNVTLLFPAG